MRSLQRHPRWEGAPPVIHRLVRSCAAIALFAAVPACSGSHEKPEDDAKLSDDDSVAVGADRTVEKPTAGTTQGAQSQPAQDPTAPAAPGAQPTYAPKFPGAGTSGADKPLTNGKLCDYVPLNGAPSPNDITKCFFGPNNPVPAATLEQVLECAEGTDVVHIRLSFNPAFVDNTYGTGAIGWPHRRGHTWADLYKSDHAEIVMVDASKAPILQFKIDYVSADPTASSGYATLGVKGGDGSVSLGNPAWIVDTSTSIDRNLNERGYGSYLVDSPATDANYTPNASAPNWDYRVVYEAWVNVSAFGQAGFGGAQIEYVHASPAKGGNDTIEVKEGKCPPPFCSNPDGCGNSPPPQKPCETQPDQPCNQDPPVPPPAPSCVPGPDAPCGFAPPAPPSPPPTCDTPGCVPVL
jgi:hypothetical protein